jgi:hypothetical protein
MMPGISKDNLELLYEFCDNVIMHDDDTEGGPPTNSIITWGTENLN